MALDNKDQPTLLVESCPDDLLLFNLVPFVLLVLLVFILISARSSVAFWQMIISIHILFKLLRE